MIEYKNKLCLQTGVVFLLLLFILIQNSCINSLKGIKISVSQDAELNDTIIVCKIENFSDLNNGSSALVVDSLVLSDGTANYNPKNIDKGSILRLNFYPIGEPIDVPGGLIKKGSSTNYIFLYYDKDKFSEVLIKDSKIQNYSLKSNILSNNEYYKMHKFFNSFLIKQDEIIDIILKSKKKSERDSIIFASKDIIVKKYQSCIDSLKINWKSFKSNEAKILGLDYFVSEFLGNKESSVFIDQNLNNFKENNFNHKFINEIQYIQNKNDQIIDYYKINEYLRANFNFDLENYRNKIVVLSFWASWCGPCRQYNKFDFQKLYSDYRNSCEIVSISLDKDKNKWKKAAMEDNVLWNSFIELKAFDSEIVKYLKFKGIPFELIIFQDRSIINLEANRNLFNFVTEKINK